MRARLLSLARSYPYLTVATVCLAVLLLVAGAAFGSAWWTGWQAGHGRYPTGHLTYTVPAGWSTTVFTGGNPSATGDWWDFADRVTVSSPSQAPCRGAECQPGARDSGASIDLMSRDAGGSLTVEAWYRAWTDAIPRQYQSTVLAQDDFDRVTLGGQPALCAANAAGSSALPPHPAVVPRSEGARANYPGPDGSAALLCYALWQGRTYALWVTVWPDSSDVSGDLRDAAHFMESVRFE
jgi:hypothetical protein